MKRAIIPSAVLVGVCLAATGYGQDQPPAAAPAEPVPAPSASTPAPAEAPAPVATTPAPAATTPAPAATTPAPAATTPAPAAAKAASEITLTPAEAARHQTLGLPPGAPQTQALPGGLTPAFGAVSTRAGDWRFDFHGFVTLPLRLGIGKRADAGRHQKVTTLHAPPMIPGSLETFDYLSVIPDPWAQLNFSYGNPMVTATVIIAARTITSANGYFDPPDQLGINDAFLTFHLPASDQLAFNVNVGAFSNRYGSMGEYDLGRYATPLIGRISGMGVTGTSDIDLGDADLMFEGGFTGQLNKAPVGVEPAGWNGYADPNVGTSFVGHAHGSVGLYGNAQLGLHGIYAFVQDDRATTGDQPDGHISVEAVDLRFTLGRFGHLYSGVAYTKAVNSRPVSAVLRVLNAPGGLGLMREYFGPDSGGNGSLTTVGAQYDFSLGNFLRYPGAFDGNGPDVVASLFGMYTHVSSQQDAWDGVNKMKYGAELSYGMLSWFAVSGRYDRVMPNLDDSRFTTAVLSPRLIFRTGWNSRDQVVLQYSRWLNGSRSTVVYGAPPVRDPSYELDDHVVSLSASMWW